MSENIEMEEMETSSNMPAKIDQSEYSIMVGNTEKQMDEITIKQIQTYICKGATKDELFWFVKTCQHLGLDPIAREVWFVKYDPGQPGAAVVGYRKYLQVAYAHGVTNIIPRLLPDDDNYTKCEVTLQFESRPDFVWTTWLDEVMSTRKDGSPNRFWAKSPRMMLIKCASVAAIRYAGIGCETLPLIQEELPIVDIPTISMQTAPPLEVATVERLPEHEEKADFSALRKTYFKRISGMFDNDEERRKWQKIHTEVESVSNWGMEEYSRAFDILMQLKEEAREKALDVIAQKQKKLEEKEKADPMEAQLSQEEYERLFDEAKQEAMHEAITDGYAESIQEGEPGKSEEAVDRFEEAKKTNGLMSDLSSQYIRLSAGRFDTSADQVEWQKTITGKAILSTWKAEDYQKAIAELSKEEEPESTGDPDLVRKFNEARSGVFTTMIEMQKWNQDTIGKADITQWTPEDFRRAIVKIEEKKAEDSRKRALEAYRERANKAFSSSAQRLEWQESVTGEADSGRWTFGQIKQALAALPKHDNVGGKSGAQEASGQSDDTLPITPSQITQIRKLAIQGEYTKLGSTEFRAFCEEVTGRSIIKLTDRTQAEGEAIIEALEGKLEEAKLDEMAADSQQPRVY